MGPVAQYSAPQVDHGPHVADEHSGTPSKTDVGRIAAVAVAVAWAWFQP